MASLRENNHIRSNITDDQFLNADNFIGNGISVDESFGNILLEDGSNLLQENGVSFFLLE